MTYRSDRSLKIALLVAALPPVHDAIGEYSVMLADAMAGQGVAVMMLTDVNQSPEAWPRHQSTPAFDLKRRNFDALVEFLSDPLNPEVVLLQFNPFCWGRRGWAFPLVNALKRVKRRRPALRLAVMFHETYTMSPGARAFTMRLWQVPQFQALLKLADARFFSVEKWADDQHLAGFETHHLPVGSNLPAAEPIDRSAARAKLGIPTEALICGLFGSSHPSRPWSWIGRAIEALTVAGLNPVVLYVGAAVDEVRAACPNVPVLATGRIEAGPAARHFEVMDLFISPFVDGVSTRRGSVMAALQHGVAVATTDGHFTDRLFRDESIVAMSAASGGPDVFADMVKSIAQDRTALRELGKRGQAYYHAHFDWPVIASRVIDALAK